MEERMRILKRIEEGMLTAEEAVKLMDAMNDQAAPVREANGALCKASSYDSRMFRIIVDSPQGDKVNVQLPVSAIKRLIKASGKLPVLEDKLMGLDIEEMVAAVSACLDGEVEGDFVNVKAADGTIVRIFVDKD